MKSVLFALFISAALAGGRLAAAQAVPIVKMNVTLPDGETKNVSVRESGTGTVALADGTEIGVRPTILDAKPWTHIQITLFRMPTTSHGVEEMGSFEVKSGGPAVQSKTNPALKVAVTEVTVTNLTTS